MRNRKGIWKLAAFGLLAVALVVLVACKGGVSQSEYDAVKQQLATQEQKAAALQQQLSTKVQEAATIQQQLDAAKAAGQQATALQQQLAAKEKEIADLKQKAQAAPAGTGLAPGGTILLAAQPVPTPTPRPTPTPPPAGYVPPPAPVPPASFSQPFSLYIYADTITAAGNESKYSVDATGIKNWACVQTSVFARGMHLVWRFEVVDIATGKRLTPNEVASAVVKLPTGEAFNGRFGRHGSTEDAPWFWTSSWDIPMDYALGTLDWSLVVTTKDGKNGTYKPWVVSIPERAVESRLQIIG